MTFIKPHSYSPNVYCKINAGGLSWYELDPLTIQNLCNCLVMPSIRILPIR